MADRISICNHPLRSPYQGRRRKEMKFWKWLRDALSPKGTPVFLVAFIAFLLSMLITIYIRSMVH